MLIEYPSGYPKGYPGNMSTGNPFSNTRFHPSSNPDMIKRGIQESQVSLQKCIILYILQIISSLSSRKRATQMSR